MANYEAVGAQGDIAVVDSDYHVESRIAGADIFCVNTVPITITLDISNEGPMSFNFVNRALGSVFLISGAGEPFIWLDQQFSLFLAQDSDTRIVYDPIARGWRVCHPIGEFTEDITVLGLRVDTLTASVGVPGFVTEFATTDPNYPFTAQNSGFAITAVGQTIHMTETGPIQFLDNVWTTDVPNYKEFPPKDLALADFAASFHVGLDIYYLGIDHVGTYSISATTYADDPRIVELGLLAVSKTAAGVVSFIASGIPTPVITRPNMFRNSPLLRHSASMKVACQIKGNAGALTLARGTARITGETVNWPIVPVDSKTIGPVNPAPLRYIDPAIMAGSTLPNASTLVRPAFMWNGSAVVPLQTNGSFGQNATLQRIMITVGGGMFIQFGSVLYPSLQNAVDAADNETFVDLLAPAFAVEVCRIALVTSTTDLTNPAQANIIATATGLGGALPAADA